MKPMLLAFALLAACAAPAHGQGYITWDDAPSRGGVVDRDFGCDTDAGSNTFVITVAPYIDLIDIRELDVTVLVHGFWSFHGPYAGPIASPTPWWDFTAGGCRAGALGTSADFQAEPWVSSTTVEDPWGGTASFAATPCVLEPFIQNYMYGTWGRCQLQIVPVQPVDLLAGHEYYIARGTISNRGTLSGSCGGCCQTMQISTRYRVMLGDDPTLRDDWITQQGPDAGWWVGQSGCMQPVATSRTTWGALKGAYR